MRVYVVVIEHFTFTTVSAYDEGFPTMTTKTKTSHVENYGVYSTLTRAAQALADGQMIYKSSAELHIEEFELDNSTENQSASAQT
jgi:hypothetical protein